MSAGVWTILIHGKSDGRRSCLPAAECCRIDEQGCWTALYTSKPVLGQNHASTVTILNTSARIWLGPATCNTGPVLQPAFAKLRSPWPQQSLRRPPVLHHRCRGGGKMIAQHAPTVWQAALTYSRSLWALIFL